MIERSVVYGNCTAEKYQGVHVCRFIARYSILSLEAVQLLRTMLPII